MNTGAKVKVLLVALVGLMLSTCTVDPDAEHPGRGDDLDGPGRADKPGQCAPDPDGRVTLCADRRTFQEVPRLVPLALKLGARCGPCVAGPPKTITVPSHDYPTIQRAISAVADGGQVMIRPGVYREQLQIVGKRVDLIGLGGAQGRPPEIAGPLPREVVAADHATGAITYGARGGGIVRGLVLRGNDAGIVGRTARGEPPPGRVVISRTTMTQMGRGILWQTGGELRVEDSTISNCSWNGISVAPKFSDKLTYTFSKLAVLAVENTCILIKDTPADCSQQTHQIKDVHLMFCGAGTVYGGGGIWAVRSGACIYDSSLLFSVFAGIFAVQSAVLVKNTDIFTTLPTQNNTAGDGVFLLGGFDGPVEAPSVVTMLDNRVWTSHRTSFSVFGSDLYIGGNEFVCQSFHVEEPHDGRPSHVEQISGNPNLCNDACPALPGVAAGDCANGSSPSAPPPKGKGDLE